MSKQRRREAEAELEKILQMGAGSRGPRGPRRYGDLIPLIAELYRGGCSIKQLERMLPVSNRFIRTHLEQIDGFKFRSPGPRDPSIRPSKEQVLAIFKRHGIRLEDMLHERSQRMAAAAERAQANKKKGRKQ